MKVLAMFDYSQADRAWELWKNGQVRESPEQNLWGITKLHEFEINVEVLPYRQYPFLTRDIEQQIRVIIGYSKYDVIYSTCQTSTLLLTALRLVGLFHKPLVVKLERPFSINFLSKIALQMFAQGHSKLLCLSSRVYDQLRNEVGIHEEKLVLLDWGPDLPSYVIERKDAEDITSERLASSFFMSAGNTSRDYNILVQAFSGINNSSLRIYCSKASAPSLAIPHNTEVYYDHPTSTTALSWQQLLEEYSKAYAIAIPLQIPENRLDTTPLYGLTSLLDAMAMGKAVVMTKHQQVNIDIETEGIGIWVEPGDIEGWQKAISYLLDNPQETQEMGKRARRLAENRYNLEKFSEQLAKALKSLVS